MAQANALATATKRRLSALAISSRSSLRCSPKHTGRPKKSQPLYIRPASLTDYAESEVRCIKESSPCESNSYPRRFAVSLSEIDAQYLIEQPYGVVFAGSTALPAAVATSAART